MLVAALSPLSQGGAHADAFDQQLAALQAQASGLTQQIQSLQQQSSAASGQALAAAQALSQTQAQTAAAQQHLDAVNAALQATTAALQDTQAKLGWDRQQLGQLVVNMYQLRADGTVVRALIDGKSFEDAMATLASVSQVSDHVKSLIGDMQAQEAHLAALKGEQQQEQQQAAQAVAGLQSLVAQQSSEQQQFQQQAAALGGQAGSLAQQLQGVQTNIGLVRAEQAAAAAASIGAVRVLGDAQPPFANGPRSDYFPWGQCTWYVASMRDVSWSGDAWVWAATAAAAGMPEGMTPRTGAIAVFGRGGAYSSFGHVGYVVAVDGPTSFTVDEGNFFGLGIVDRRSIGSLAGVETFIY